MPLYQVECKNKKTPHVFDVLLPVDRRDEPQKCRFCKSTATRERIVLRGFSAREEAARAQAFAAPVVYKAKDGTYRFPGATNSKETQRLDRLGYERIELKDTRSIRRFEKSMNEIEGTKHRQFIAGQNALLAAKSKAHRDEFRQAIATGRMVMVDSEKGSPTYGQKYVGEINEMQKDMLRAAMEHTDRSRPTGRHFEPGFNIQAFSYDSSNREEHSDASTGWRGRKY